MNYKGIHPKHSSYGRSRKPVTLAAPIQRKHYGKKDKNEKETVDIQRDAIASEIQGRWLRQW